MDLIAELTKSLGIDTKVAQSLAGATLGGIREQVVSQVGEGEAKQMDEAIPESKGWMEQASGLLGDAGASSSLGGLGSLVQGLGGSQGMDLSSITGILAKLNIAPSNAMSIVTTIMSFLKGKLPPALFDKVAGAVPMLKGDGAASAVKSALGGLF